MKVIYLDWAATAPPDPEIVKETAETAINTFGNPSSVHSFGREAEKVLVKARLKCADILACKPKHIIFTSGGSESNNMILSSVLKKKKKGSIIISGIEHSSIYNPAIALQRFGFKVILIPADRNGTVSIEKLEAAIDESTIMVSIMHVNNETGAIQPVSGISKVIRTAENKFSKKIHFHLDAVQSFCKIPFDVEMFDIDSASISAHKTGAPRGAGILYLKPPIDFLYKGGGQEMGNRPGTENLPAILGLCLAAEKRRDNFKTEYRNALNIKSILSNRLKSIEGCRFILEKDSNCSPYILSVSFPPVPGEVLVRVMNDRGFAVSTGSACSSQKKQHFRVLDEMGVDRETAFSVIRISTGYRTTEEEIHAFCDTLENEYGLLFKTCT